MGKWEPVVTVKQKRKRQKFSPEVDEKIIDFIMKEGNLYKNRYAEISRRISEYTAKRIRQRWINLLDPTFCHDPLSDKEKELVTSWVKNGDINRTPNGKINWKYLIAEIKKVSGNKYSENHIRNFWYGEQRKCLKKDKNKDIKHKEDSKSLLQVLSSPSLMGTDHKAPIIAYEFNPDEYRPSGSYSNSIVTSEFKTDVYRSSIQYVGYSIISIESKTNGKRTSST